MKKKYITYAIVILIALAFSSCNRENELLFNNDYPYETNNANENNPQVETAAPSYEITPPIESTPPIENADITFVPNYNYNEKETINGGTIEGDIYYNDIALSRIFTESFIDLLGEPNGNRGHFFF